MMSWHLRYFQHQSRCQGVTLSVSAIQVARQSRLYESAPAYVTDQPRFINAALAVETALPPMELLRALKRIEVPLFWHRTVAVNACSQSHQIGAHKSKHDFVAITQSFGPAPVPALPSLQICQTSDTVSTAADRAWEGPPGQEMGASAT